MTNMQLMPAATAGDILGPFGRALAAFAGKYWWVFTILAIGIFLWNYYESRLLGSSNATATGLAGTVRHIIGGLSGTAKLGLLLGGAAWWYVSYALGIFPGLFKYIAAFDPFIFGTLAAMVTPIWVGLGNVVTVPTVGTGDGVWIGLTATAGVFALVFGSVLMLDVVYYEWQPQADVDASSAASAFDSPLSLIAVYAGGLVLVGGAVYSRLAGGRLPSIGALLGMNLPDSPVAAAGAVIEGVTSGAQSLLPAIIAIIAIAGIGASLYVLAQDNS